MLGKYEKAIELYQAVYDIRCRKNGEDDSDTMIALYLLAKNYDFTEQYSKAAKCYEKVYLYRCKTLGEEHADTIDVKEKLEAIRKKI